MKSIEPNRGGQGFALRPKTVEEQIETLILRWYGEVTGVDTVFKPDMKVHSLIKQLEALLSKTASEARLDELKRLKGIDAFNEAYSTDPRPSRIVSIRIKELEASDPSVRTQDLSQAGNEGEEAQNE